tara:strand:- start:66 stop:329 length:264 start_codon:yes stop_codon:yes gene_type:complete
MEDAMILVPKERLSVEIVRQIILEYVSREGTDYGHGDWTMDEKVAQVMLQLERGEVVITYDDITETCNLLLRDEALREIKRREEEEE